MYKIGPRISLSTLKSLGFKLRLQDLSISLHYKAYLLILKLRKNIIIWERMLKIGKLSFIISMFLEFFSRGEWGEGVWYHNMNHMLIILMNNIFNIQLFTVTACLSVCPPFSLHLIIFLFRKLRTLPYGSHLVVVRFVSCLG